MTTARAGTSRVTTAPAATYASSPDLHSRDEDGAAADAARAAQRGPFERASAVHRVVVRGHRAGAEEDVVLDDRPGGHVHVRLDPDALADRHVVVDRAAAADDGPGADRRALADVGLVADDRLVADRRRPRRRRSRRRGWRARPTTSGPLGRPAAAEERASFGTFPSTTPSSITHPSPMTVPAWMVTCAPITTPSPRRTSGPSARPGARSEGSSISAARRGSRTGRT